MEQADAVIVPSAFARERLRELGAPLPWERVHVLPPPVRASGAVPHAANADECGTAAVPSETAHGVAGFAPGGYALVVSRLAPEKGVDVAIDACRIAGVPLVVAGDGPERGGAARARAGMARCASSGRVEDGELRELRAGAAIALAPSRSAETFGLAAAEAMAAGVPVVGQRVGALAELVERDGARAGGRRARAGRRRSAGWPATATRASGGGGGCAALCAPEVVARKLGAIYDDALVGG